MKYSLRSLMIAVLVLPPLLALGWWGARRVMEAPDQSGEIDDRPAYYFNTSSPLPASQAPAPIPPKD